MTTELYNTKNEKIGTIELPDAIFSYKWNADLVHQVIESLRANQRKPWAHAKGRGEVRGGGRKPWRQKGTGRARHGSTRSPLWPGGGVSHGPQKERNFDKKINKKMKRAALFSTLSKKLSDHELKVLETVGVGEPKTKLVAAMLKHFEDKGRRSTFLIIPKFGDKNIYRAASNLENAKVSSPSSLNVHDILKCRTILVDREALATIKETYAK